MKELKEKIIGYATFTIVFFLHVYFALLLGTSRAMAQETPAAAPTAPPKIEKVDTAARPAVGDADQTAPQAPVAASPKSVKGPKAPKPAKAPELEDTEIKIKLDPKEGFSVKGLSEMVEKLEAIDKRHKGEDREVTIDGDGVKIKKSVHVRNDDEDDDGDNSVERAWSFGRFAEEVLLPITLTGMFFLCIAAFFYFRYRSRREAMETVRLFLEKGQPIPADLMASLKGGGVETYQTHLLHGLKPIFWGIGILTFFALRGMHVSGIMCTGMVLVVIGLYHVTKSYLIQREKEKNPTPVVDATVAKTETNVKN